MRFLFILLAFCFVTPCWAKSTLTNLEQLEHKAIDARNVALGCYIQVKLYKQKGWKTGNCQTYIEFAKNDLKDINKNLKEASNKFKENKSSYSVIEQEKGFKLLMSILSYLRESSYFSMKIKENT